MRRREEEGTFNPGWDGLTSQEADAVVREGIAVEV